MTFVPVEGDSITSIAISNDEYYLGVGTEGGMIKIYKVEKLKKLETDKTPLMHVLWQTHTNRVTDLFFMKTVCSFVQKS